MHSNYQEDWPSTNADPASGTSHPAQVIKRSAKCRDEIGRLLKLSSLTGHTCIGQHLRGVDRKRSPGHQNFRWSCQFLLVLLVVLLHFDQVFSHASQRGLNWTLLGFVTGNVENWTLHPVDSIHVTNHFFSVSNMIYMHDPFMSL